MSEAGTQVQPVDGGRRSSVDIAMTAVIVLLFVALVALGAWWGYGIWVTSRAAQQATPALRTLNDLRAAVAKSPRDASLRVRLAEALAAADLDNEAVSQLKEAVGLDAKHIGAWLDLGLVYYGQQDYKSSRAALEKVATLTEGAQYEGINTQREQALFTLGRIALRDRRYDDAVRYLKGALRIKRDASDTYLALALAYKGLKQPDAAQEQLSIALAFDPNYAQAHYELAMLFKADGKLVDAAEQLRRAVDSAPDASMPKDALAAFGSRSKWLDASRKEMSAGQLKKAQDDVRIALAIDPKYAPTALQWAAILEKLKDKKKALAVYQQILSDIDSRNVAAKQGVARLKGK